MLKRSLVLLTLLAAAAATADAVYRDHDESGRPVFTDQPAPGAEELELSPVNTVPAVTPRPPEPAPAVAPEAYEAINIDVAAIIPNGLSPVTIGVHTQPALREGHSWRLILDDVLVAESRAEGFTFPRLNRGEHVVSVEVVDAQGRVLAESDAVTFFVYWPGGNR